MTPASAVSDGYGAFTPGSFPDDDSALGDMDWTPTRDRQTYPNSEREAASTSPSDTVQLNQTLPTVPSTSQIIPNSVNHSVPPPRHPAHRSIPTSSSNLGSNWLRTRGENGHLRFTRSPSDPTVNLFLPSETSSTPNPLHQTPTAPIYELDSRPISRTSNSVGFWPRKIGHPHSDIVSKTTAPELSISQFTPPQTFDDKSRSLQGSSSHSRSSISYSQSIRDRMAQAVEYVTSAISTAVPASLLRSHSRFASSKSEILSALSTARITDAWSKVSSNLPSSSIESQAARSGSVFEDLCSFANEGNVTAFVWTAEDLRRNRGEVDKLSTEELDSLIRRLNDYKDERVAAETLLSSIS